MFYQWELICFCLLWSFTSVDSFFVGRKSHHIQRERPEHSLTMFDELSFITTATEVDWGEIISKAGSKAVNGGIAGASAAAIQVLTLMWLRTTVNYQYRYGSSTFDALSTLYKEGGIPRLYRGLSFALLQGPLSRFGDTASNALTLAIWAAVDPSGAIIPLFVQTATGSVAAGVWRIFLMPIDTCKTKLQVSGDNAWKEIKDSIQTNGVFVLYNGAVAASAATFVGHFPWFLTYNYLSEHLPSAATIATMINIEPKWAELSRSAVIGLCASSLSDTASNSLRVLKTAKQTISDQDDASSSYVEIAREIIDKEGVQGLLGRGLQTKIASNAVQGVLFSVLFKYFQQQQQLHQ